MKHLQTLCSATLSVPVIQFNLTRLSAKDLHPWLRHIAVEFCGSSRTGRGAPARYANVPV